MFYLVASVVPGCKYACEVQRSVSALIDYINALISKLVQHGPKDLMAVSTRCQMKCLLNSHFSYFCLTK